MLKKMLIALAAAVAMAGFAQAVEVNSADQAQLESVKGIGPATAKHILDERKKGAFKDWQDFAKRVKGVGGANSAKFSDAGLTVNGQGAMAGKAGAKGSGMSKDSSAAGMSKDTSAMGKASTDKGGTMGKPEKAGATK